MLPSLVPSWFERETISPLTFGFVLSRGESALEAWVFAAKLGGSWSLSI